MPDPTEIDRLLCCPAGCGRPDPDRHGPCSAPTYGATRRQALEAAGYTLAPTADLARHDARVTELLEANNREVERRRRAEAAAARALHGCACPPGAEAGCRGPLCPRRPLGAFTHG